MIAASRSGNDDAREIARGLATAIRSAVKHAYEGDAETRAIAWSAASDVAELLALPGLGALLSACEPHLGAPPKMVTHALERLSRLAHETFARGDMLSFHHADRQLTALAGAIGSQEWTAPGPENEAPQAVQSLAELLTDFAIDDPEAIADARVTMPVAAGVRAALDWLGADMGGSLRATMHEVALSLAVRAAHEPGLAPAGAILALTGGALLPDPDGRWSLRVPLHTESPAFLLVRQGEISLALPWHAVARLRIADDTARAVMTEPSLRPWSPLVRTEGERPAALLALGLTRAWLHFDHVVWRVFATPEPAQPSDRIPGGRQVVRTEEGEEFWVVEVSEALRGVPPLHTPPVQPRPRQPMFALPIEGATGPEPALAPAAAEPVAPPAEEPHVAFAAPPESWHGFSDLPAGSDDVEEPADFLVETETPRLLGPEDVHPIGAQMPALAEDEAPASEIEDLVAGAIPHAPTADAAGSEKTAAASATRLALVVDDSLVARLSLGRVLEREGWMVEWVEHASEMWDALHTAPWGVVFVDVSLPDASGRDHLRALVAHQKAAKRRFEVVALTRDAREDRMASDSGITRKLRKPFTQSGLEGLVRELPVPAEA